MTETDVCSLYEEMLGLAAKSLQQLPVFCGKKPTFSGLSGWVFEQTIQKCTRDSLIERGVNLELEEQPSLGGRAKADLRVGSVVLEVKAAGLFNHESAAKYRDYQSKARARGLRLLFLTRVETDKRFRDEIVAAIGRDNVIFLDEVGSWRHFIDLLLETARERGG